MALHLSNVRLLRHRGQFTGHSHLIEEMNCRVSRFTSRSNLQCSPNNLPFINFKFRFQLGQFATSKNGSKVHGVEGGGGGGGDGSPVKLRSLVKSSRKSKRLHIDSKSSKILADLPC